jgi:hypothetical protein
VETLRKLARVYGVRVDISFKEFGTLIPQIENLKKNLSPRKFEDDPAFKEAEEKPELQPEEVLALASPSDFLTGVEVYTQAASEFVPGLITFESISPHALAKNAWIEALTDYGAEPKLLKISFLDQPKAGIQDAKNASASGVAKRQFKGDPVVAINRNKKTIFSRNRLIQKKRAG